MIQSVAQLDKLYGECGRRIIFDNCQYQAILRANDAETQKYLAELIGTRICRQNSVSESLDKEMNTTGYSRGTTETLDWAVCPHELSTIKDVLLMTPYGFCRVEKIQPRHAAEGLLPAGRRSMPPEMLTIEERAAKAERKIRGAGCRQPPAEENDGTMKGEGPGKFSSAVGEQIIQQFPEILDLESGFKGGSPEWKKPLADVLARVADDQTRLEKMKREAGWPGHGEANV